MTVHSSRRDHLENILDKYNLKILQEKTQTENYGFTSWASYVSLSGKVIYHMLTLVNRLQVVRPDCLPLASIKFHPTMGTTHAERTTIKKVRNSLSLTPFLIDVYCLFTDTYFTSSKTTLADYQNVTNIMVQIW